MRPDFFGDDRTLFGIYHPPRGNPKPPVRAVVICPPFGQDYIRSHWSLRLLAGQLARKGMHVLRFDYFGIGDSLGCPSDVKTMSHWEQNVESAIDRLLEESNADSCQLLGLRTGAALAARVATRRSQVNSLLLWEPVDCGEHWLQMARGLHAQMIDLWVCKMQTVNDDAREEILGTIYSRELVNDLGQKLIDWDALELPHLVVDLQEYQTKFEKHNNSMQKFIGTEDEESWSDLRQLETAWLRPQTTRLIVENVDDTFERLIQFGVLSHGQEITS